MLALLETLKGTTLLYYFVDIWAALNIVGFRFIGGWICSGLLITNRGYTRIIAATRELHADRCATGG